VKRSALEVATLTAKDQVTVLKVVRFQRFTLDERLLLRALGALASADREWGRDHLLRLLHAQRSTDAAEVGRPQGHSR
jgi:hypothetical protein